MMAKLMTSYRVGVVGSGDRALIESLGMLAFASVDEALAARVAPAGPRLAHWPWQTVSTRSSSSPTRRHRPAIGGVVAAQARVTASRAR